MASVPYEFECDKGSGFVMDPNKHPCFGYLTALNGFGLGAALAADLQVSVPFNTGAAPTYGGLKYTPASATAPIGVAKVVGVLEKFAWPGGVGDAITLDFWCSQNATQIKSLQQLTLKNTSVTALSWWVADYDQETKLWYEKSHALPVSGTPITGIINGKDNPELNVDLVGAPAADGIDVMVYKVSIQVVPAANFAYWFHMANSSSKKVVKTWGLVVGTLAASAVPAAT